MNKKAIKSICAILGVIMLLCGCVSGKSASPQNSVNENGIVPNIKSYGAAAGGETERYAYIVDMNTGVVYLAYDAYYRHAITVMLNADGTPVLAEQLGLN